MSDNVSRIWAPQPGPQTILVRCHVVQDILYGGARGGGKTDGALGDWLYHLLRYKQYARGLFVRPTMPELEDAISRAKELFQDTAEWREQKKTFIFFGGGSLKFRHLRTEDDARKYQGHAYTWIEIEEAGNYPTPGVPDLLRGTLRSVHRVICRFLMTANPGGVGHNWVKTRFIDAAPPYQPFDATVKVAGKKINARRIFIPALLSDNQILLKNDPEYETNLALATVGKPWLYRAWRYGDWDIVAGGMFDSVWDRGVHVLKPFKIPDSWEIRRSFDWGSSKPFSVGWWAVSNGEDAIMPNGRSRFFPPGTFIRVAEWYGWRGRPNEGCGLFDSVIAQGIVKREKRMNRQVSDGPADSSIFTETNGRSIAHEYRPYGIFWKKADKSPGSRITGARKLTEMLGNAVNNPLEHPCLYVFDNCTHFIRTVPTLPRDSKKLDDVNTDAEDHVYDESRYAITYRASVAENTTIEGF